MQGVLIILHHRFRESDETRAVLHAPVGAGTAVHWTEIDDGPIDLTARTEQRRVGSRSVKALVECRHTRRDQLHLHAVERSARGRISDAGHVHVVRVR